MDGRDISRGGKDRERSRKKKKGIVEEKIMRRAKEKKGRNEQKGERKTKFLLQKLNPYPFGFEAENRTTWPYSEEEFAPIYDIGKTTSATSIYET